MKKYLAGCKYKRYNSKRAVKSLKAKLRHKDYQRRKNENKLGVGRQEQKSSYEFGDYRKVVAPKVFTFIGNPEPFISFVNELKRCFNAEQKVFVVLKNVERIDYDAIVVLLSIMVRFKSHNISFNGDFPKHGESRRVLNQSGFIENLYKKFGNEDRYGINTETENVITTHAWKNVDSALGASIIANAAKTVWGREKRCQGAQRALLELMLNTNNHATPSKEGDKHWWLSVNHSKKEQKVRFSFVDYGVGIFKSLENKPHDNKFYKVLDRLRQVFNSQSNADLLRLIMNGELHKTATGEYYRGKGLPGIYESMQRNWFSNLHIVSNDSYANISENEYRTLKCDFGGTFVYWELNATNLSYELHNEN